MRFAAIIAMAAVSAFAAGRDELITNFKPSSVVSKFGPVSETQFSTGLVVLEPGMLAHHLPGATKYLRFSETVWVIGYRTEILDAAGKTPRENYLCHTFLSDQRVDQHQEQEFSGIYSDAFTPDVRLPDGVGVLLPADERIQWMPMFNNRGDQPVRVAMRVTLTMIRAKDLSKPLKPVYASLRSVHSPHLFFVDPGRDERQVTFQLPFNGAIYFLGTHVHPYGESVGLYNVSRSEQVWKGVRESAPDGPMQTWASAEGYPVHAGETWRITAVYANSTDEKVDAMAGLFMLYSRN